MQALGWGAGLDATALASEPAIAAELQAVLAGVPVLLDRWNVSIAPTVPAGRVAAFSAKESPTRGGGTEHRVMVNYLSIGVCAAIALDFHELRRTAPALFCSRLANKLL